MQPRRRNKQRKTTTRKVANPNYKIVTFGSLGFNSGSNNMVFDGVSGFNFDIAAYMESDYNFDRYVRTQYSFFRIRSVSVKFIPRDPNNTAVLPPPMFVMGLTFGRDSGTWTVTSIDQLPGSKTTSAVRGFNIISRSPDKTWFTTVTSDEPMPKIRMVTLPVTAGSSTTVMGVLYFTFDVECKGRLV
jgi:hypothetical protein